MSDTIFAPVQSIDSRVARQGWGTVRHGADEALWVEFHERAIEIPYKSAQAGRPIYETRVYCRMTIPSSSGTIKSIQDEEANAYHKQRFPRQWAAFEQGKSVAETGTPLEQWPSPLMGLEMVATCKHLGIHTVEQLAALNDSQQAGLGPLGRQMTAQAKAYIEEADKSAITNKLAAENAALLERLAALEKIVGAQAVQDSKSQPQEPAEAPAPQKRRA